MAYQQPPYKFERLDKDKAILLIVDHQLGLLQLVKDYTTAEFRNNVLAHAELGKLFDLPTILTTSAETGPNGPLPKEITDMYPDAPFIRRNGEVNAWDNPDFRKAVEAIWNVKVERVNTMRVHGKTRRMGRTAGRRPDWKKAMVKLAQGHRIEFFDGLV